LATNFSIWRREATQNQKVADALATNDFASRRGAKSKRWRIPPLASNPSVPTHCYWRHRFVTGEQNLPFHRGTLGREAAVA
jgi:hypothetical protein